jgi:hypothetical protein
VHLDVSEVEVLGVNVKEFELEGFVSLFGGGSISSLEVEHHIEFLGSVDISQEADEVFKERDDTRTLSSPEMVVNSGVVLNSDLLSQALKGFLVGGSLSS